MVRKINKVLVGCIFAFSLVLVCSVAMAANQSAKILGTDVNVRNSPNTESSIITTLSNSMVSVVDSQSDWYKIDFSGKTGWVYNAYVKVKTTNGSINANGVNLRETADISGKVIGSLNRGKSVIILDTISGWHKVKVGNLQGYIATKFVTADTKGISSRSTTAETLSLSDDTDDTDNSNVVTYAKKFVGVRYVYGGMGPTGFDCSGFVSYVYKNFGISLNRSSDSMYYNGTKVSKGALKAGDILFFDASARGTAGSIDHVGIYIGNNKFIHASTSHGEVIIQSLSDYRGTYIGAKRVN